MSNLLVVELHFLLDFDWIALNLGNMAQVRLHSQLLSDVVNGILKEKHVFLKLIIELFLNTLSSTAAKVIEEVFGLKAKWVDSIDLFLLCTEVNVISLTHKSADNDLNKHSIDGHRSQDTSNYSKEL